VACGLTVPLGVQGPSAMDEIVRGICSAAREGRSGEVAWLVGHYPGLLNARDDGGKTPLIHASAGGHVELVRWLVEKGAAIHERDEDGKTPLIHASGGGHVELVRWLVEEGVAINERDVHGCTALRTACSRGHAPVLRLLIERGADLTIPNDKSWTPLIIASIEGHLEVVRVLLGHPSGRATVNHRSSDGRTALWYACRGGRLGVLRALLASGADPRIADDSGTTPMARASQHLSFSVPSATHAEGRRG
jgi:ankyrin repeat protein